MIIKLTKNNGISTLLDTFYANIYDSTFHADYETAKF